MARKDRTPSTDTNTEGESTVTEATVTEEATVTPDVESEGAPDISAFVTVATSALDSEDFASVTAAYNELDRKGKGAATRHVNAAMKDALQAKNPQLAISWSNVSGALTATKTPKEKKAREPKAAVDNTQGTVERLASLYLAYQVAGSQIDPEKSDEIKAAVKELVEASDTSELVAWRVNADEAKGDAPEASDVVQRAVKLAFQGSGKKSSGGGSVSTYDGPRRSIGEHIGEAFEGKDSGTFLTVAELRNFTSTVYGEDHPSAGAISSALKSGKSLPEGITASTGGPKGNYGAVKA